ncbi:hypothetical protein [Microvirga puerhi]|uniref:Uncharacterized protein n=1 Tax=Microvirga puerhi TaxID=2876078 RepID=A0ABS7VST5_9HYPH|nr:hypothetical protein [Microvirga puerhi]MBZ6078175.1 hypothetical protein [Microvirga puerhi]
MDDVSMKREVVAGQPTMAIYVSGRLFRSGLSEQEATSLMAELLNRQYTEAKTP